MKNKLITTYLVAIFLYSCGAQQLKSDAKKIAALRCEITTATKESPTKVAELEVKLEAKNKEMMKKYNTAKKKAEFLKTMELFLQDCDDAFIFFAF